MSKKATQKECHGRRQRLVLGVGCACCAGVFDCALTVVTPYSIIIPVTVVVMAVPVVIPEHPATKTEKAERQRQAAGT